jgi:hypothetical protein
MFTMPADLARPVHPLVPLLGAYQRSLGESRAHDDDDGHDDHDDDDAH